MCEIFYDEMFQKKSSEKIAVAVNYQKMFVIYHQNSIVTGLQQLTIINIHSEQIMNLFMFSTRVMDSYSERA